MLAKNSGKKEIRKLGNKEVSLILNIVATKNNENNNEIKHPNKIQTI